MPIALCVQQTVELQDLDWGDPQRGRHPALRASGPLTVQGDPTSGLASAEP